MNNFHNGVISFANESGKQIHFFVWFSQYNFFLAPTGALVGVLRNYSIGLEQKQHSIKQCTWSSQKMLLYIKAEKPFVNIYKYLQRASQPLCIITFSGNFKCIVWLSVASVLDLYYSCATHLQELLSEPKKNCIVRTIQKNGSAFQIH